MPFLNGTDTEKTVPLWIRGKAVQSDSNTTFPIISSATGATVHKAVSASAVEANLACETSAEAFKTWRKTTPAHRRRILYKAAEIYQRRAEEIAGIMVAETSCHPFFAKWNIQVSIEYIQEIAASSTELRGMIPQRSTGPDGNESEGLTLVITEPVGTVLIIPP